MLKTWCLNVSFVLFIYTAHLISTSLGVKICQLFNINPSDLLYKWEAITLDFKSNHSSITRTIDADSLRALKVSLQRSLPKQDKRSGGQPAMLAGVVSRGASGGFMGFGARPGLHSVRPTANPVKREVDDRKPFTLPGSGKVKLMHVKTKSCEPELICFFAILMLSLLDRYMYEKPSERSDGVPFSFSFAYSYTLQCLTIGSTILLK